MADDVQDIRDTTDTTDTTAAPGGTLAPRHPGGPLTDPSAATRRDARGRADQVAALFTELGPLPDPARQDLFGPTSQWALYVRYAEGPVQVGVVLDPPLSVHAPSPADLDARVRSVVAERRGVVEADVHAFGKQVPREVALTALRGARGER
ncbi:hypothetical protein [Brachybacterium aquaticum]|uniref:Uncharacterized protein n=1 Tax=Brachybacterium aquaticum TaxID=1432564 RepID=A0A841AAA7_9MICO|nr:hypothetical protein [Brachybacterium aquaticum]MBB5830551.1 hypothetical protein [Brachybacterium aquaticum]